MWTQLNGDIVATTEIGGAVVPAGATRLNAGRAYRIDRNAHSLAPQDEVDWRDIAQRLADLGEEVASRFVGLDELCEAMTVAVASGQHLFVLGPPGCGKSSVVRLFAEGVSGNFFRVVLNPDLPRDAVFGALDPRALSQGRWERKWAFLAQASLALLDEVGKASPQVMNMLLDALEERRVTGANGDHPIPLLSAMAASNEALPKESAAVFDRLLLRLSVGQVADHRGFTRMLVADRGAKPVPALLNGEEIQLLAAVVEALDQDMSEQHTLVQAMLPLFEEWQRDGISNRRWLGLKRAAIAKAVLEGQEPAPAHLSVGRWVLWMEAEEEARVRDTVLGLTDPMAGQVLNLEADLADLQQQVASLEGLKAEAKIQALRTARELEGDFERAATQDSRYRTRLLRGSETCKGITQQIIAGM